MINISALPKEMLDDKWEYIKGDISKALAYCNNEMDIDDVYNMIEEGTVLPLMIEKDGKLLSVVTLEIMQKPLKKIIGIMTAGGNELDLWLEDILKVVENLARDQQADSIYINGRKGWLKKLDKYEYKHAYTVLTKEVH